ncbi:MAG: hypothetical protein HY794_14990 [Desulfarculus sp.]|nr:hypothetical protein [Desulfarculus sp.]
MATLVDIRTLVLAAGIIAVVLFAYLLHVHLSRKTYPGFALWTRGSLAAGTGLILIALRGVVPDLLSIVLSGALIIYYPLMILKGLAAFAGRRLSWWPDLAIYLLFTAGTSWFTYGQINVALRIFIISLALSYYCLRSALLAAGGVATLLGSRNWMLIASLAGLAALFLARGLANLLGLSQTTDFLASNSLQAGTFMASFAGQIFTVTGLVSLNMQRLEQDLALSQREVNLLSGLLPICANCKRIRDDSGYWHQVEAYISSRSEAKFSHGICPQCIRELYPDISEQILSQEKQQPAPRKDNGRGGTATGFEPTP